MKQYKVLFVGFGSIGKRHIRNLTTICQKDGTDLQIDLFRHSLATSDNEYEGFQIRNVYHQVGDVPTDYDFIFLTNPTEYHLDVMEAFHNRGRHFFIEKPLSSVGQIARAEAFAQDEARTDSVYYVAGPLRYCAVLKYIKDNIDLSKVISVRSISSSFLPDWRPGQDYRETYSAHKDLGGGVDIDLIHEWDYLTWLFGAPEQVSAMSGKISDLEIDSPDYAIYLAKFPKMIAELHLDYFGRSTIREIQLFTGDDTIVGDIARGRITYLKSGEVISLEEERDAFQIRELRHFLGRCEEMDAGEKCGSEKERSPELIHAIRTLKLTQGQL